MLCITFDIDDTLYLERDYVRSGFEAVGAAIREDLKINGFAEHAWALFESGVRGDIFDRTLNAFEIVESPTLIARLVTIYREHSPSIGLLPDVANVLTSLRESHSVAVVSDGPLSSQSAKVAALALERWTDNIVLTAGLGPGFGKPHPRAFELVQRRTGTEHARCVYVADNPRKDFAGPHELGWRTVRIRRPGGLHEAEPSGDDVGHEISNLSELAEALR